MFDIGPDKLVVVAAIAFLMLGPDRFPQLARSLHRARGHFQEMSKAIPSEALQMIREPRRALMDVLAETRPVGQDPAGIADKALVRPVPLPDDATLN